MIIVAEGLLLNEPEMVLVLEPDFGHVVLRLDLNSCRSFGSARRHHLVRLRSDEPMAFGLHPPS